MMDAAELREARSALADTVARFARHEIAPHVGAWDAAGEFPRALYRQAADLGLLGLGYPEAYGGTPAPHALRLAMWVALCRYGTSGGVLASLLSHKHRPAAGAGAGQRGRETRSVSARAGRRAHCRAGDHRAGWRLGRGGVAHDGAA